MDKIVVDAARSIVGSDNRSFEDVLEKLENTRMELEAEKEKAEKATEAANKMRAKAQSEKDKIDQLKANEMEKVKREAEKISGQLSKKPLLRNIISAVIPRSPPGRQRRSFSESFFESSKPIKSKSFGKTTAPATTGPARQPRPTSSMPAQMFSFAKS